MSSRSESAPVGQCVMHWPHATQPISFICAPPVTPMFDAAPEPMKSHTPMPSRWRQAATQRPHLMQRFARRWIVSSEGHWLRLPRRSVFA